MIVATETVALADLVAAVRRQHSVTSAAPWFRGQGTEPTGVLSAHSGAGASTVSAALAEAAAVRDTSGATLVDLARDDPFGASAAIETSADLGLRGWTGGRRGRVQVVRPADGLAETDPIPGRVIVDAQDCGWTVATEVLVARATIPSILRAERVLALQAARAVAVAAASKWPPAVRASLGPRLRAMDADGMVVFFPRESELEINGLSAEPLPSSTIRAAHRLLDLLEQVQSEAGSNGERP